MRKLLMTTAIIAGLGWSAATGVMAAPVPAESLSKPPADAKAYVIASTGGVHGQIYTWRLPDGTLMERASMNLRGQKFELEQASTFGADHMPSSLTVRGFTPNGDAAETFAIGHATAIWKSQVDTGEAAYTTPKLYVAAGGAFVSNLAMLTEALIASPSHSVDLLPGGKATIEKLTELQIGQGTTKRTVVCWAINGLSNSAAPVWTTPDGKFFAAVQGMGVLPTDSVDSLAALNKAQDESLAARSPALVKALLQTPKGPVAFTHVRAFVDGQRFVEDETVIVDKGVISAVGPSASTPVPKGAQIIDGKGKTLSPGLWDSHMHVGDDSTGPMLLSLGVTSVRDPGNDDALTVARAERRAKGDLLSPHVYASSLIDGKGPNTAQVANVATSQDEAIALVRKAKAEGMVGVKFYGTFNPAWLPAAAAEAHKLGLHVHGHIPATMRPAQAIDAGYDEITHINFVLMQAMPDEVVNVSNGIARFEGPGRFAKGVDLNADPMKSLIATMARKQTASDPTLVTFESLYVPENGDLSPAYAPYVGTLPPAVERGFRQGGFSPPAGLTRADYREAFGKLKSLAGALHKAGVPIVAGTDGSGLEIVRELELYVEAGFTPAEALAAATLAPAHNVGVDKTTGSIAVGKVADLVLVEGDPSKQIGALRNTRMVVMDGKLMDADALRTAAGFSGRPKL